MSANVMKNAWMKHLKQTKEINPIKYNLFIKKAEEMKINFFLPTTKTLRLYKEIIQSKHHLHK